VGYPEALLRHFMEALQRSLGVSIPVYLRIQPKVRENLVKTPFADQTSDAPADRNLQHVCDLLRRFFDRRICVFCRAGTLVSRDG
jgi:hypothetical protein